MARRWITRNEILQLGRDIYGTWVSQFLHGPPIYAVYYVGPDSRLMGAQIHRKGNPSYHELTFDAGLFEANDQEVEAWKAKCQDCWNILVFEYPWVNRSRSTSCNG